MIGSDPIFSVSEFIAVFNQSLEVLYPRVGIVGELSNFRISRNQWVYFDLKDEFSQAKFFGSVRQLPGPLEDGLMLEVFGRPRLHPQYGFSINVESIRPVGKGSIKKAQDLLARKLETEGLFDPIRKRPIPYAPDRIGLITAVNSAACADFRKIIDARWGNVLIQLIDVQVQGVDSPAQIIQALNSFNEMAEPPEVIVLIRGGGSPEDLASFSDESVVRSVASSRVPTLVAIGHEIDVSLAELAADARASTPSNAAELLVPDVRHERQLLNLLSSNAKDMVNRRLSDSLRALEEDRKVVDQLTLDASKRSEDGLVRIKQIVNLLDPSAPLRRGFALTRDKSGKLVRSAKAVKVGDALAISLSDGTINSKVTRVGNGQENR